VAKLTEVPGMTIDELGQRAGLTVRNIRAYQSRGLLRPPQVVGRTGYYDDDHLARLELIKEMQGDGFNLGAIGRLLEGVGDSSGEVLDFTRAIRAPFEDEEPEIVDRDELTQRWGGEEDDRLFRRGEKLGLLRDLGGGKVEIISPRVIRAGAELAELGIALPTALDVAEKLRRESREVAKTFIELFLENVWKPFDEAGRPDEEWPQVREALERLRPLASESLLAIFGLVMTEATEKAFGRALERESKGDGRRQRSRSRRR
jgi:DNA-binding transcriptional MerR regulator